MVGYCIICKWRSDYEPRRMFHRFPTDAKLWKVWLKIVGRTTVKPNVTVCSLHFKKSCYAHKVNGQPYLKQGSVPTLHIKEQPRNLIPGRFRRPASKKDVSKLPHWRTPPKKLSNPVKRYTCEICESKFVTINALRAHSRHVHKNILSEYNIVKSRDQVDNTSKMPETDSQGPNDPKSYKPSFECPLCDKKFTIYFTAFQHIQKCHCVNQEGKKVSPLSLDIVKPIRIELCVCKEQIRSDKTHYCPLKKESHIDKYFCLGCEQTFHKLSLFHLHLKGLHGNDIESYYFTNRSEFNEWKTLLQHETNTNYVQLSNAMVFQCSHQPTIATENMAQLCPSTIIVKEIQNGFHMVFYKTHAGHSCEDFRTPESHKKHCITTFYKDSEDIEEDDQEDEKDLYLQFKKIMKSIVLDAAKINITTLNVLLGKALEMTVVLNSYDEDDDSVVCDKKLSDEQISRVLEDKSLKRSRGPLQRETKRVKSNIVKVDIDTNQIVNNNDDVKIKVDSPVTSRIIQSPSSFNDSYKSFVDQTIMKVDNTKEKKKREVLKTKIGQFKLASPKADTPKTTPKVSSKIDTPRTISPNISNKYKVTPKSVTPETKMPVISKVWTVKPDVKYEVKEQDNDCNILILKI